MKQLCIYMIFALGFAACTSSEKPIAEEIEAPTQLDSILSSMYAAHGTLGNYQFIFRDNVYSFQFEEDKYCYTKSVQNDSINRQDTLKNDSFVRYENGERLELSSEDVDKYTESLNSVVYFVCLPLKLQDPSVNKNYLGEVDIKSESYHIIEVYFDEEGGGTDHDDVFAYWVNQATHQVDYLAYQYATNGGGVRFRSAFNSRMVGAMRFQDYVNYGAPVGTELVDLPALYELDSLHEFSQIITESVEEISN